VNIFKDGFLYKEFPFRNLQLNVKPSLDEIKTFTRIQRHENNNNNNNEDEDLDQQVREREEILFAKKAQQLARKGPAIHYNKGDLVQVFEGELRTLIGKKFNIKYL
jgi:hypothetical protein